MFEFRPLTRGDIPLLVGWMRQPHVAASEWSVHEATADGLERDFGPAIDGAEPTDMHVVAKEDGPFGLVQSYRIGAYPEWLAELADVPAPAESYGIDYLIGDPNALGLGAIMIRQYVETCWARYTEAPSAVVAAQQDNSASWRALEKAGFSRIWGGVLPSDRTKQTASYVYELHRPTTSGRD